MNGLLVTSGRWCWLLVLLLSFPATLMSSPPLSRVRVEAVGPNEGLKPKNCSLELDRVRAAAQKYISALGFALNDESLPPRPSVEDTRPSPKAVRIPLTIARPTTIYRNKTTPSFGRANLNSHRQYLSSSNDSRWVAQCLNGEKCVNRNFTKEKRLKNQDPQRRTLDNPIDLSTRNHSSQNSGEIDIKTISPYSLMNYNIPETNNSSTAGSVEPHGLSTNMETATNSDEHVLPQDMTGRKGVFKPLSLELESSIKPEEKYNRLVLPIPIEGILKERNLIDKPEYEKSVDPLSGFKNGSLLPETSTATVTESSSTAKAKMLPQDETGTMGPPVSKEELSNDFEQQNSLAPFRFRPEISAADNQKTLEGSGSDDISPISIQLKPVIHNHYYNRRQTKVAQGTEESSMLDFDFRPLDSIVEKNQVVNVTNKSDADRKIEYPKVGGPCEDPKTPGCESWASEGNLVASGDLVRRLSTGKRQSDVDNIDSANSESAIKTDVQNTDYPEKPETIISKCKKGNSNIFLFMGGQWHVNLKDHPELTQLNAKSTESTQNVLGLQDPAMLTNYGTMGSWPYNRIGDMYSNNVLPSSEYPTPGALPSYYYVGSASVPHYPNQNGILASRSSEKHNSPLRDYSRDEFQAPNGLESYYYTTNPSSIFPLPASPRLSYPESLVNFPLDDIKKNQGANMGFPPAPAKPEEHLLHDIDTGDMAVVGAQMLSIFQPSSNLPDNEYPLQPVANNDMSSSLENFPSARDSSVYQNQRLAMYNYQKLQQIPSIYNTSHSSGGQQVYLPSKILIKDRNPSNRNQGSDVYDFVSGQYVKRYRSSAAPERQYGGPTAGNWPVANARDCLEENQRYPRTPEGANGKPGSEQVWANSTVRDNLKRDKRDRTLDNEDPGEGSWPSIEKIIRDVERNLRERENYPSVPYSYGWDSSQLADPFREEEAEGRRGGQRKDLDVASMLRDLPLPSRLTTSRPFNTERFIYRRVAANEKKILAISIRRSLTTTLPPHHRNAQWQEVSNSKAHLHHRWLQKGKLRGKLLT
ncbi:hypothetical protein GE061_000581 [Apolygus lucorum]|uniref:Uncharacterized protein n=1 Tax=Apolygus lucorum TaxID=248454 RepID=A0A8S9Y6M0_APOLU|nr:hypothetical protein GE061_000581 [Apolygus lucorum]